MKVQWNFAIRFSGPCLTAFVLHFHCGMTRAPVNCVQGDCQNGAGEREISTANSRGDEVRYWYTGQFLDGLRHGFGHDKTFLNNQLESEYRGNYRNDFPHGWGRLTYFSNKAQRTSEYVGDFRAGKFEGSGSMYAYLPDGRRVVEFKGSWRGGLQHGYGIEYYPFDGSITRQGIWENGEFVREEKRTTP